MENKAKKLICIAVSEILIIIFLIVFFNLPFTKAVSWNTDFDTSFTKAVNTRYTTNYSKEINEEINKIYEKPLGEDIKAQIEKELAEKKPVKKSDFPIISTKVISNSSNASVLEIKRNYVVKDHTKLRSDNSYEEYAHESDCWHLNIYIDKNGLKISAEKIY